MFHGPPSTTARPPVPALALLVALALATACTMASPLLDASEKVGRNDVEGWNAYHAKVAMRGEEVYPGSDRLISNNYPPLSFYVVGAASTLSGGDTLFAGRWISLVGLLIVATNAFWMARVLGASRLMASLAPLLVLGMVSAHFPNYVALDDPQMLGQALQFTGLSLFVTRGAQRRGMLGALALMLLGGLVKHNLVALPLGVTVWLAWRRRSDFRVWCLWAIVMGAAATALMAAIFGAEVFRAVLGHARTYHLHQLPMALHRWLIPIAPLLAGAFGVLLLPREDRREELLLVVASLALGTGLLFSLGAGVNYNVIFDGIYVASILAALFVDRLLLLTGKMWARPAGMLAVASTVFLAAPLAAHVLFEGLDERAVREAAALEDLAFVRDAEGAVLCQDPAICYWAGKPLEVDFFNFRERIAKGRLDGAVLESRIERGEFAVIQLRREGGSGYFPDAVNRAIGERYALARSSSVNGYFYVPRR